MKFMGQGKAHSCKLTADLGSWCKSSWLQKAACHMQVAFARAGYPQHSCLIHKLFEVQMMSLAI